MEPLSPSKSRVSLLALALGLTLAACSANPYRGGGVSDAGGQDASTSDAAIEPAAAFLCGNWADTRDNFVNGNLLLSGLSSTTASYDDVRATSDLVLGSFQTLVGANSVRLPVNEPTALGPWWNAYRGTIDAAVARGMKVIVSYWAWQNGHIEDMDKFRAMWDVVVRDYTANNQVYFQIFNEPWMYSPSASIDIAVEWVTRYPAVPRGRIIVAGSYSDNDVRAPGADARLDGTLLSLHIYPFTNGTQTSVEGWRKATQTNLGAYADRTIVTEWGGPMTTGADYTLSGEGDHNGSYVTAVSGYLHDNMMGSCHWPVLRNGDAWSLTTLSGTGTSLTLIPTNASGLARVRYAFNL